MEELASYCCSVCAESGANCRLADREIVLDELGSGPITPCSKCGHPMDPRKPNVAYEMMSQTESGPSWPSSAEPHESTLLAPPAPIAAKACPAKLRQPSLSTERRPSTQTPDFGFT